MFAKYVAQFTFTKRFKVLEENKQIVVVDYMSKRKVINFFVIIVVERKYLILPCH